jgi:hypothetical protein
MSRWNSFVRMGMGCTSGALEAGRLATAAPFHDVYTISGLRGRAPPLAASLDTNHAAALRA